jgi:hypothetical protein
VIADERTHVTRTYKHKMGGDGQSLLGPALANLHGQYNFQSIAIALVMMKEHYPQTVRRGYNFCKKEKKNEKFYRQGNLQQTLKINFDFVCRDGKKPCLLASPLLAQFMANFSLATLVIGLVDLEP